MRFSTIRNLLVVFLSVAVMSLLPAPVHAQLGGLGGGLGGGGLGGGGLGGGGLGGGGLGGGGGGFNIPQGAGVVVDAEGVLRMRTFVDPGARLHKERFAAAKAALDPHLTKPNAFRKISLNRLEAAVASRLAKGESLTEEMKYLAGLLRIHCVFFYPETNDIVIAGPAEGFAHDISGRVRGLTTGRAVMELEDLVVALRAFPPSGAPTPVVGVSIDPTQQGLTNMQQFLASLNGRVTPNMDRQIAAGLRQALGLQNVTISGVSPRSHFAQVLVEADYRMKLIGIGLERPAKEVGIKSYIDRANPRNISRNAMQRWYFTPDYECVRVSTDRLGMELVGWGVKLVGQDELVAGDGTRAQSSYVDLASKAFCENFTERYPALAEAEPVYAQLRNLIDLSVVAAFIQQQDYYSQSGWTMSTFGSEAEFPVETYEAPQTVESAVNVVWKGRTLTTPIGGGVTIQPREALNPDKVLDDENDRVKTARTLVKLDSLADGQWWWD